MYSVCSGIATSEYTQFFFRSLLLLIEIVGFYLLRYSFFVRLVSYYSYYSRIIIIHWHRPMTVRARTEQFAR